VLLDPSAHLDVLDQYGALSGERAAVGEAFARWQQVRAERERVRAGERERASRTEFVAFQLAEIERAAPRPGEDDELSRTREVLANADKLQRLCGDAYDALYEGDQAVLPLMGTVWRRLAELTAIDSRFAPYLEARETVKSQLEDLAFFLRSYASGIDASPARLQDVEDRLAVLERLKKKHGPSLDEVIARAEALRRELHDLQHGTERAAELDQALEIARAAYMKAGEGLTAGRRTAAEAFGRALEKALGELAMPRTRCEVRFVPAQSEDDWSERGLESGEFYISPNPGEELRPLARIASGGELSRIMLALKTLASTDAPGKSLIFDEVDAGIGGAVADVVGSRLQRLGDRFQVLCITHLPQIAAHGSIHFRITKRVKAGRTVTEVARLDGIEREQELARMIAGSGTSAAVMASAREMLESRRAARSKRRL
jgi:DNA repair protein RecN (Recombination protein N)